MSNPSRFRNFIAEFTRLIERAGNDEPIMLDEGGKLLKALVSHDDWLPEECAKPHTQYYQQYLLYCDPLERYSVVSFVWGPGQKTPVQHRRGETPCVRCGNRERESVRVRLFEHVDPEFLGPFRGSARDPRDLSTLNDSRSLEAYSGCRMPALAGQRSTVSLSMR